MSLIIVANSKVLYASVVMACIATPTFAAETVAFKVDACKVHADGSEGCSTSFAESFQIDLQANNIQFDNHLTDATLSRGSATSAFSLEGSVVTLKNVFKDGILEYRVDHEYKTDMSGLGPDVNYKDIDYVKLALGPEGCRVMKYESVNTRQEGGVIQKGRLKSWKGTCTGSLQTVTDSANADCVSPTLFYRNDGTQCSSVKNGCSFDISVGWRQIGGASGDGQLLTATLRPGDTEKMCQSTPGKGPLYSYVGHCKSKDRSCLKKRKLAR